MTLLVLVLAVLGITAVAVLASALARFPHSLTAIVAGAGTLALHGAYLHYYVSDDAYISFRYARNWANGLGPVWNPGEHVDGYTNFLWTAGLAAASKAGLPLPLTASWAGYAASLAVFGLIVLIAQRWPERSPGGALRWLPLATVVLLAANGGFATWTFAGLESTAFAALVLLGVLLHLREDDEPSRAPWSGLALFAAAATRPEGVLFFAVTALFKGYRWWSNGRTTQHAIVLVSWALLFLLPYAALFAWHWSYYGHPLPNSFYAKVGSGIRQYQHGLEYVARFGREYGNLLALFALLPLALWPQRRRESAYLLVLVVVWAGYLTYIGGDSLVALRMFVPVLPLFYLLSAAGALSLIDLLRQRIAGPGAWALAATGLIVALAATIHVSSIDPVFRLERIATDDRIEIGRWLRDHVPEDQTVALHVAGAIPYQSRLRAIDILGINDEHIAHSDVDRTFFTGHEKYDSQYVLARRPELIILTGGLDARPYCLPEDYAPVSANLIAAVRDLVQQPELFELYRPESAELSPGRWLNLLVRKDVDFASRACSPAAPS
jgi:arabinofuranosyltransferase